MCKAMDAEGIGSEGEGVTVEKFREIPLFMTIKEAAHYSGKHEGSIRRDIETGALAADRVGGKLLICKETMFPNTFKALMGNGTQS